MAPTVQTCKLSVIYTAPCSPMNSGGCGLWSHCCLWWWPWCKQIIEILWMLTKCLRSFNWFRFFIHFSSLCSHTLSPCRYGDCALWDFFFHCQSKFGHLLVFFTYTVGIAHMTQLNLLWLDKNNFHVDLEKLIFLVDYYGQTQNFHTLNK